MTDEAEAGGKPLSRKELEEQLARSEALLARVTAAAETLERENAELKRLSSAQVTPRPGLQARPYKGLVRAIVPCHYNFLHATGDIFEVDLPALWTDDPFVPVVITQTLPDGTQLTEENKDAPKPLPFELRPRSADVLSERSRQPMTADKW